MEKEKNKERIPQLRFPEFKNAPAWEQRKLGEVAERVRGNDGRMDLPTLTISAEKGWLDQRERFSANIAGKEQKNYTLLRQGELSYNHGNSKLAKYGVVFELQSYSEALVPKVYHSFRMINDNSATFIEYMFATKIPDRELGKLISSGARMDGLLNINYDEFMGIRILIPTLASEQTAIGDFFSTLDRSIALHQRELENLKNRKKSLLQKMFPKNGESVPKIRFPEFKNAPAWEQRKLGEVVSAEKKGKAKADMIGDESVYLDTEYLNGGQIVKVNAVKDTYLDDVIILWDGSQAGTLYYGFEGALGSTLKAYTISESSLFINN